MDIIHWLMDWFDGRFSSALLTGWQKIIHFLNDYVHFVYWITFALLSLVFSITTLRSFNSEKGMHSSETSSRAFLAAESAAELPLTNVEREGDRQTDRQTIRQTERDRERQWETETERQTNRKRERGVHGNDNDVSVRNTKQWLSNTLGNLRQASSTRNLFHQ